MSPSLEARAKARAEALGLKFSPYVTLCVEAELKGFSQIVRDDSLDIEGALRRAREYMGQKTASIDFESDVEAVIERAMAAVPGSRSVRLGLVGGLRVDFLIETSAGARIVVECRSNVRQNYALSLGQGLLLRSHPEVGAVALVVPYLEGFDPAVMAQFNAHGIHATTPDSLGALLASLLAHP
jgi:hypothetical protein